jgi:hypothetical protein
LANIAISAGQILTFNIDNRSPGGDARTHGYWKNWSTCGGGPDRAAMALRTGNHLLDEFLPIQLVTASGSYGGVAVTSCVQAADILTNASAKFAEHQLAVQLLAAKLNLAAGASACDSVRAAIATGDSLLAQIRWNGSASSAIVDNKSPLRALVLATASTLDEYNNGRACS